jgi:hypothetical protein
MIEDVEFDPQMRVASKLGRETRLAEVVTSGAKLPPMWRAPNILLGRSASRTSRVLMNVW